MQKREKDREMETHGHTHSHSHTHSERERERQTAENGALHMHNFDGPSERPLEISNPWSLPV